MTSIRMMGIQHNSVVDGKGIRDTIFVSGCPHHCSGCHNPETWNILNGTPTTLSNILSQLNLRCDLTLSGGEPFMQAKELTEFLLEYKKYKVIPNIWIYSGYLFEELISDPDRLELLKLCNVLVDGRFDIDKKEYGLKFRGSSNQRIIDVQKSLKENKVVLLDI